MGSVTFRKMMNWTAVFILLAFGGVSGSRFTAGHEEDDVFWSLTDVNKTRTCILLSGMFEIAVPYYTDYYSKAIAIIHLPRDASVNGFCEDDDPNEDPNVEAMSLSWSPDQKKPEVKHTLEFTFKRSYSSYGEPTPTFTDPYFFLDTIQATIMTNRVEFPDAFDLNQSYQLTATNVGIVSAPEKLSYYCKSTQVIKFDGGSSASSFGMSAVHVEAFHDHIAFGDGNDFGPKSFCATDGVEVIMTVLIYVIILALIGLAIFYIMDSRSKRSYVYL